MPDLIDKAQCLEEEQRQRALGALRQRPREAPDEDEHGRYCLDCGDVIPDARLVIEPFAVRCVECLTVREKQEAIRHGGVR
jgi:DnaK suppressor protein